MAQEEKTTAKEEEEAVRNNHDHDRVQLWEGGPYWATRNIGAENPEDYGLYFWWGDTVGYRREDDAWVASDGSSRDYEFCGENTPTVAMDQETRLREGWTNPAPFTRKDVLAPSHDAARAHWGGNWRMPTHQELSCLKSNCDWTWTTLNGVTGYVVRGRGDYASASIFLPAAGFGSKTSLDEAGSFGCYWSSFSAYSFRIASEPSVLPSLMQMISMSFSVCRTMLSIHSFR